MKKVRTRTVYQGQDGYWAVQYKIPVPLYIKLKAKGCLLKRGKTYYRRLVAISLTREQFYYPDNPDGPRINPRDYFLFEMPRSGYDII